MKSILKIYHNDELVNTITQEGEKAQKELLTVYHALTFENGGNKKTKMYKNMNGDILATTRFITTENEISGFYYRYEYQFIED